MTAETNDDIPARRLRNALEPIATLSFHSQPVTDSLASGGLTEFGPRYTWSRSSVLGTADPSVVVAAFGVWEPTFVEDSLRRARQICSLADVRRLTHEGVATAARDVLSQVDPTDIEQVVEVLWRGVDACGTAARPLLAGNRALPRPDDVHTNLWRAATAWRELRGDSNLAACITHGLSGLQANVINELHSGYPLGEYTATRNWSDGQIGTAADVLRRRGLLDNDGLSDDGRALRDTIESHTDAAVQPAIDAVGDRLDDIVRDADRWSQSIIERGWFPDDDKKRAAG